MPKTLAALARSQYATALEDVSGNLEPDFLTAVSACAIASRSCADVLKPRWHDVDVRRYCARAFLKSCVYSRLAFEDMQWREDGATDRA